MPSVFDPHVRWITFVVAPAYIAAGARRRASSGRPTACIDNVRWAIEERAPHRKDQRNTFFAPWRLTRVLLVLWGVGTIVLTTLYGLHDTNFIPKWLLGVSFPGIVVSASCYLFTEFALRPVAAQALEAGPPPRRFAPGIMGRTMLVWALGSGVPVLGILLAAIITLSLQNVTPTQFTVAVMILALFALVFGFILMWILSWLTATPVRVVRAALNRVEQGDLTPTWWCSTAPNSASCSADSTRWSPVCASANGCAICSAGTSGARSPRSPRRNARSWAARSATPR